MKRRFTGHLNRIPIIDTHITPPILFMYKKHMLRQEDKKKCHMSSYLSSHLLSKPSLVICLLNENHMKTNNQCLSSSTCNLEAKPSFNAETRGSSNVILIDYLKGCSDLVTTRVSPWHAHTHKHTNAHKVP